MPDARAPAVQLALFDEPPACAPVIQAVGAPRPLQASPASPADPARPAPPRTPAAGPAPPAHPRPVHTPATLPSPTRPSHEVQLGGHRVPFHFRRARRRSIGFVVGPEGLSVSAPRWVAMGEVEAALRDKSRWILRKLQEQQDRARRLEQARIDWRDGTTVPFLGETVVVVIDPRMTGAVLNTGAEALPGVPRLALHVGLPHGADAAQLRDAVQSWLQRQARRVFEERCRAYAPRLGVQLKRLSLSSAATRWGSASADGSVRLNWRLIHFALPVIDYVVVHELAHLREMNHSPAFWEVVRSVVPDYEQHRGVLRSEVVPAFE